jgi:ATP-binding cassette subfamily C protein LapB
VPQYIELFFGTIKDNIMIGASWVDDERVELVARLAGVTDFTDRHPQGLDMPVGEGAESLRWSAATGGVGKGAVAVSQDSNSG